MRISQTRSDKKQAFKETLALMGFAAFIWVSVALFAMRLGIDWLQQMDSRWYWELARNLGSGKYRLTHGYSVVLAILFALFPSAPDVLLMQLLSGLCYLLCVPSVYHILRHLAVTRVWQGTLLFLVFPLVGTFNSVVPRLDALLNLLITLIFLSYLKRKNLAFVVLCSFYLIAHRSAVPLVGLMCLIGLFDKRLQIKHVLVIAMVFALYIGIFAVEYHDLLWYFKYPVTFPKIHGLPLADGLLGTFTLAFRGDWAEVIKAGLLFVYISSLVIILLSQTWTSELSLLAFIVPGLVWSALLPHSEMMSVIDYGVPFVFPLMVHMQQTSVSLIKKRWFWLSLCTLLLISQYFYCYYTIKVYYTTP